MLSRKRANLRANALLQPARAERERAAARSTRFLVFLFPQLSTCEPSKRWSAVVKAREHAMTRKHVRIVQLAVVVSGVAWLGGLATGWEHSSVLLWIMLVVVLAEQLAAHVQTRVELRAMAHSPTALDHDGSASG